MDTDALVARYPRIYHMAEKDNWDSICKHGLLSTSALLDLFEYEGKARAKIESEYRPKTLRITHGEHGEASIRDQYPMSDRACLLRSLVGITPQEWFELLNGKTFFWADTTGLNRMLGAMLYRQRSHLVFTVDTGKLIARHADDVTLSSFNSGSLYGRNAEQPRSRDTFKPVGRHTERWVAEFAVDYSVPDIFDFTISVEERTNRAAIKRIWPP